MQAHRTPSFVANLRRYVERYERLGLYPVPLAYQAKVPPKGFKWAEWVEGGLPSNYLDSFSGGVAIACGEVSIGLCAIDIDDAAMSTRFLEVYGALLGVTPIVKTSRGIHVWLRCLPSWPEPSVSDIAVYAKPVSNTLDITLQLYTNTRQEAAERHENEGGCIIPHPAPERAVTGLPQGIYKPVITQDLRPAAPIEIIGVRDNGRPCLLTAPPSIHPSGHVYRFLNKGKLKGILEINDIWEWLFEVLPPLGVDKTQVRERERQPIAAVDNDGCVGEGQRHQYLLQWTGKEVRDCRMRGYGFDVALEWVMERNQERCNPALPEKEVEQMVRDIWRKGG